MKANGRNIVSTPSRIDIRACLTLYINDFWKCLDFAEAIMFADDTTLVFKDKDIDLLIAKVNEDLSSAENWFAENKLSLNIKKTKYMLFDKSRSRNRDFEVYICNKVLERVKSKKFLGITFDEKLAWKEHINVIISKLNSCLGISRRARPYLNRAYLMIIYHSLMQSHINYCNTTWAAWEPRGNKALLRRLQAVCNKFIRLTFNIDRTESVRDILRSQNILNVYQKYDFSIGQLIHKAVNGQLPIILQNSLVINNEFFFFKNCRLKQTERSVVFSAPKVWNNLPLECIEESNFQKFKTMTKKNILEKQ